MQKRNISTTKYQPSEARPPDEIKIEETENCWEVFLSIILQTFGIDSKLKSKFWEVLKNQNLENLAKNILHAAKGKDWPRTTMLLRKFLTQLASPKTLRLLETAIGKEAFEKILKTFGSRFVPWLGWGLMALCFVTSLSTNWERLRKCHF